MRPDPSMEEILASIKRVIAEETPAAPARGRDTADRDRGRDDDILDLGRPLGTDPLVSDDAAAASRGALASLAEARRDAYAGGDGPLEQLVREMLKPMLSQWLDERLPPIVEDLVRQEIARIARAEL